MKPAFAGTGESAIPIRLVPEGEEDLTLAKLATRETAWARLSGFSGKLGASLVIPDEDGAAKLALVGWGDARKRAAKRFALASFAASAPEGAWKIETPLEDDDAEEAALAWLLAAYRFDRYKSASPQKARLVPPANVDADRLLAIAEGVWLARNLVNTPANDMGPDAIEEAAEVLAAKHAADLDTIAGETLLERNLPMIHAVGRASAQEPRLIDLTWGDPDHPKITLVGKGVAFDTGGLDLKPAAGMRLMKKDMGGAAAALGLAHMIMTRGLPVRLRVLIPAVENSVSAASFRPGDILTSRLGLTVEIGNTDAEGRLILADALTYASEESPDAILDFATLTGAARVALGPDLPPYFTDDEKLAHDLELAARQARDPIWRLPLHDPYDEELNSPVADLDNAPSGGFAGAITAALFLRRFVGEGIPWAHFDIYGHNPKPLPGRPQGGETMAARAVFAMLEARHDG